jgi:hypothetical protein
MGTPSPTITGTGAHAVQVSATLFVAVSPAVSVALPATASLTLRRLRNALRPLRDRVSVAFFSPASAKRTASR